jgi:hypothetical protein
MEFLVYFPPFTMLINSCRLNEEDGTVTIPKAVFSMLLFSVFYRDFEPNWYRATYEDVAAALNSGEITDELSHFSQAGYFEGRKPSMQPVDEEWYKTAYPDVAAAIRAGVVASAHVHYNTTGYFEGRAPDSEAAQIAEKWQQAFHANDGRSRLANVESPRIFSDKNAPERNSGRVVEVRPRAKYK